MSGLSWTNFDKTYTRKHVKYNKDTLKTNHPVLSNSKLTRQQMLIQHLILLLHSTLYMKWIRTVIVSWKFSFYDCDTALDTVLQVKEIIQKHTISKLSIAQSTRQWIKFNYSTLLIHPTLYIDWSRGIAFLEFQNF